MNKRIIQIMALVALLALPACVSPRATDYKSLASIGYAVDGAMKAFAQANREGKVTPEQIATVTLIHDNQFNPAYSAAILAAKLDYTAITPADVLAIADKLILTINNIVYPTSL